MKKTVCLLFCLLILFCIAGPFSAEAQEARIASVEEVLADGKTEEHKLTSSNPGTSSFTAAADCEITVTSYLSTSGEAELSVDLNEDEVKA